MREHVTVLRRVGPDVLATYVAMARRTADRARDAGRINAEQHAAVIGALQA